MLYLSLKYVVCWGGGGGGGGGVDKVTQILAESASVLLLGFS